MIVSDQIKYMDGRERDHRQWSQGAKCIETFVFHRALAAHFARLADHLRGTAGPFTVDDHAAACLLPAIAP